ncbi:MFS transporter, partial [Nonomuraea sp. RK-328]|nr:MFS transporter [Nonomuraea sp. RK-328]
LTARVRLLRGLRLAAPPALRPSPAERGHRDERGETADGAGGRRGVHAGPGAGTATLAAFGLLADGRIASVVLVFLMGVFGFAGVPGMITRVTDAAGGAPLAAGANVSASNVGNALGAWLGGLAISAGLGYTAPLYVGAAVVALGLAVMVVTARTGCPAALSQAGTDQAAWLGDERPRSTSR